MIRDTSAQDRLIQVKPSRKKKMLVDRRRRGGL